MADDRQAQAPRPAKNERPRDEFGRPLAWGAESRLALLDYDALPLADAHRLACEYLSTRRAFEAHEAWEAAWRHARGTADEEFFKGLSQLGAGYTHYLRGNPRGAVTLLRRATARILQYPGRHHGVDVASLAAAAGRTVHVLERVDPGDALPPITWPQAGDVSAPPASEQAF